MISSVTITDAEDRWVWSLDREAGFSVKSLYVFWREDYCLRSRGLNCRVLLLNIFGRVVSHLRFTADIWYAVIRWLGATAVLPANVLMSYGMLVGCGNNKKRKKGFSIVWLAFVWAGSKQPSL
ncbi:unnamed protein product [Trifolium pratense]|uniref:Uncharacterized protein n=1 Tax=Trifolium pratense TaxID=57577 RepID=A0ACB0IKD8_TRIPR|nr:unnamed protein product [Trifolium pratense]